MHQIQTKYNEMKNLFTVSPIDSAITTLLPK